jgi:hypothetical protein
MALAGLGRMSICVLDSDGLLQVRTENGQFPGLLAAVPATVSVGDVVRLLLQRSAEEGDLEVEGEIQILENGPGPVAMCDGLIFELELPAVEDDATLAADPLSPSTVNLGAEHTQVEPPRFVPLEDEPLAEPSREEAVLHALDADEGAAISEGDAADEARSAEDDEVTVQGRRPSKSREVLLDATEPSGVVGTLREMALSEVVQSLELSGKTAEVAMRPKGGEPGVVFVDRGRVVFARCGELLGEDAFFAMAEHRRGTFLIRFHSQQPASRNIDRPTSFLLLESMRRLDEHNREHSMYEEERALAEEEALVASPFDAEEPAPTQPGRLGATGLTQEPFNAEPEEPEEYDLDASDEHAIIEEQPAKAPPPRLQLRSSDIFASFFAEASDEGLIDTVTPPPVDDVPEPTFASLKAALRRLRASDDGAFTPPYRPVQTTGEFRA